MGADLNPASLAPGGNWNLAGLAPEPDVVTALLGWWWPATSLQTPQEIPEPDITRCPGNRDTCVDKLPEQRQPPRPPSLRWWGCHGGTRVGTLWCVFCSRWGGWELACWSSKFTELESLPSTLFASSHSHCLHWPSTALHRTLLWPSLDRWSMPCPSDTELQRKVTPAPRRAGLGFKNLDPTATFPVKINRQCLPPALKNQAELPPDRKWLII